MKIYTNFSMIDYKLIDKDCRGPLFMSRSVVVSYERYRDLGHKEYTYLECKLKKIVSRCYISSSFLDIYEV